MEVSQAQEAKQCGLRIRDCEAVADPSLDKEAL